MVYEKRPMIDFQYFFHLWILPLLRRSRGDDSEVRQYRTATWPADLNGGNSEPQVSTIGGATEGQTAIEYMLMLAIVAAMITIFGMLFNRKLLGGFFSLVGMIIGEGLGKT